jgi:hypothetical protein
VAGIIVPLSLRFFTTEEARAALPEVRTYAERLVGGRADELAARARLAELTAPIAGNGHGTDGELAASLRHEVERAQAEVMAALEGLDAIGVLVKDVDAGLVDFPSVRDGNEVFLCWQLGEDELAWWHTIEDGFRGRRPL